MTETEKPVRKRRWTFYGVAALILFILFVVACLDGSGPNIRVARRMYTSNQVSLINAACQNYAIEYGALPPTSENYRLKKILCGDNQRKIEFLTLNPKDVSPNGEMIDPWGTPFRINFYSGTNVDVISAGPDKIFGTPDDITNQ